MGGFGVWFQKAGFGWALPTTGGGRRGSGLGSGAASPNRWILVDLEQDALPSEPERCLPPLVVGLRAQAPMRERAAKAKGWLRKVEDCALPPPPLSTPEPRLPPVVVGSTRAPTAMRPAPNPPKSIDLGWPHRCPGPSPARQRSATCLGISGLNHHPVVSSAQPKPLLESNPKASHQDSPL